MNARTANVPWRHVILFKQNGTTIQSLTNHCWLTVFGHFTVQAWDNVMKVLTRQYFHSTAVALLVWLSRKVSSGTVAFAFRQSWEELNNRWLNIKSLWEVAITLFLVDICNNFCYKVDTCQIYWESVYVLKTHWNCKLFVKTIAPDSFRVITQTCIFFCNGNHAFITFLFF